MGMTGEPEIDGAPVDERREVLRQHLGVALLEGVDRVMAERDAPAGLGARTQVRPSAIDLGAVTMFFFTFAERETLYELLDAYTGHRMNTT